MFAAIPFLVFLPCLLNVADGAWTSDSIVQLGSAVPSRGAAGRGYNSTFDISSYVMLFHRVDQAGLLFAFSAFFRRLVPFDLVVCRPVSSSEYVVTWKLTVSPSVVNTTEDIYVISKLVGSCANVQPGDYIGAYQPYAITPIAFGFNDSAAVNVPQIVVGKSANLTVGSLYVVNTLPFPYRVLFAAYILANDTSSDSSNSSANITSVNCPPELVLSGSVVTVATTTPAAVTANVGATGATGSAGYSGPTGFVGATGSHGVASNETGATGYTGNTGWTGLIGLTGLSPLGAVGLDGDNGTTGPDGPGGMMGDTGSIGATGPRGLPGKDVILVWPIDAGQLQQRPTTFWTLDDAVKGLFAWLAVATAVLLVAAVIAFVACCCFAPECNVHARCDTASSSPAPTAARV